MHIGARVSALAGPNDVLVSSTLRDLVIGSGLEFEARGAHELKGVPAQVGEPATPICSDRFESCRGHHPDQHKQAIAANPSDAGLDAWHPSGVWR